MRNISTISDEDLLAQYKSSGNSAYFGELFNRYMPLLYGVCLKYLKDVEQSQDAVMQLFEELLPKMAQQEVHVFRTWIYSVVKNHCLQLLRKENREVAVDFNTLVMESDQVLHLLSEEEADNDRVKALNNCIKRLPDLQRISIIHFFMDEMSYADIVEKTGYHLRSVKSYIQNGKRNLKICIEKQLSK
jgi:RNA polymerase sigma-70 factor (ECF subfamily)